MAPSLFLPRNFCYMNPNNVLLLQRFSFPCRFPTRASRSLEFTSPRGWMGAFGSAPTPSWPSNGRATRCTTSTLETFPTRSLSGAIKVSFSFGPGVVKCIKKRLDWALNPCLFPCCRGLQKLVLKNITYGMGEMYRGIFIGAQVKILRRYIPEISVSDVLR